MLVLIVLAPCKTHYICPCVVYTSHSNFPQYKQIFAGYILIHQSKIKHFCLNILSLSISWLCIYTSLIDFVHVTANTLTAD